MTSDKPLLSSSDHLSVPNPQPSTLRISSLGCLCHNTSVSSSVCDETQSNFLLDLKDDNIQDKSLKVSASPATSNLCPADPKSFQQFPLVCPPSRKRLVSGSGAMELQHNSSSFEVSKASSQIQDKVNKSQRICHKSMQFEDDPSHDENARLIYVNDPRKTNDKYEFTGNEIRTSKYTVINFLPKNIFIQFHRVAYLYFLAIAALNQLPPLAVFGRTVSLFPLLFVLSVTAIKDGYEDWRRHRSDRNENNREALVLQSGKFQGKTWKKIRAGEVVKICADETIPCDMVLLGTSDSSGIAYIQTMNLDGESNLKTRYARQETTPMVAEGGTISGLIRCEQPNRNIYEFTANMEFKGLKFPLSQSNIILRGCQLKNTDWAVGVVVYAGQETKAMLNSAASPSKRSRLETHMNRETLWLSVFLFIMCLVVSVGMCLWLERHKNQLDTLPYYRKRNFRNKGFHAYNFYGIPMETFFSFLSSIIVFQIMIPISLYITMELVRLGQSYFMIGDLHMYDSSSNSRFQCRSLNINEDLGQIRYVFSDKTGTLTQNKMEFQRASVYGKSYGSSVPVADMSDTRIEGAPTMSPVSRRWKLKSGIAIHSDLMELLHKVLAGEERVAAHEFFLSLAACNTVIPILTQSPSSSCTKSESDEDVTAIDYQGESPDEQALVAAASAYGYTLFERTSGHIVIDVNGEKLRLDVLGLHEFDSVRKRMSVVIRFPDNAVKVLVKGADTSMFSILKKEPASDDYTRHATQSHLNEYSSEGLRTLVVAARDLTAEELEEWQCMYEEASTSLTDRSIKLRQTAALIESNLRLLGATAIEDKLQEGVPETIESLRQAGIKVWVLTGDKQETAISIGLSCKLLTADMQQIIINGNSEIECRNLLSDAKAKYGIKPVKRETQNLKWRKDAETDYSEVPGETNLSNMQHWHAEREEGTRSAPLALIIDGNSLVYILEKDLESELFDLATSCRVVLCCRVAPLQKAGIVDLIKSRTDDMTLAIGDGANDVSMIQMADVGVGICGQEGRQAVMASDFAMGQFRFLKRLLLVHGHWNYQRVGYLVLYNFYRNAVFVLMLFWYILFTAFSTTSALTDWSSVFYSVIYTSVPTIVVGILDKDLSHKTLLQYPKLYSAGHRQESYNMGLFWIMMIDTLWQSLVLFYVPLFTYRDSTIDIWSIGSLWTIAVVIQVNLHLAMDIQRWLLLTHAAVWGSIIITYTSLVVLDSIPIFPNYGTIYHLAKSPTYWLSIVLIISLALLPRFIFKVIHQTFWPSDIQIAREAEILGKRSNYFGSTPDQGSN
ncbi:phospholipid-transporting ATPase 1-like [Cornus florida]|uniref:phospholipid-transporting ATPase 1-like n=1 Tax=Cornus florida TaxID=4283 RepID=UPI00289CD50D|nr:phospholipid-transporting ATPase 1-like [Cornus florida]XP_059644920.1 phospholipid-transporting ATPase 1-like [Cornus florida]XP_059644921.1 phospholipid-transporting ATPase 1-like [Cornus florida]XP_059644922.1 phospholipid-transporting ATPase 1-like [Cornus florida]XP_059644923.1 phospholipid-transporting ATPase 1-like [Cornus florida]